MPLPPPLFDTHVHLDVPATGRTPEDAVVEARRAGVEDFVVPGVRPEGWPSVLRLSRTLPGVWAAPGVHPLAAALWNDETAAQLEVALRQEGVVAVGEIGLDTLIDVPLDQQERGFREQLRLAAAADLPVLIHGRKAMERILRILREEKAGVRGGIFHAFSGSPEIAREAIRLGFALSFGGPLTWPGARRGPQVLQTLPAEWIVLETDAPDLSPHPHRGEENRPEWLPLIAATVAQLRGWTLEETARITTENARRIFGERLKPRMTAATPSA